MEDLNSYEKRKRNADKPVTYEDINEKSAKKDKRRKDKKNKDTTEINYEDEGNVDTKKDWDPNKKFDPSSLKSEKFESYYKTQLGLYFKDDAEFELFVSKLREKLPCVFRINKAHYFYKSFLEILTNSNYVQDLLGGNDLGVQITSKALTNLPEWKKLVYNINIPRMELKKNEHLSYFHKFIQKSVDSGLISRQEAVSMIPPMLMQVKKNESVFDMCAAPGSKTAQFLEVFYEGFDYFNMDSIINDRGFVLANDNNWNRAYMMVHQLKRLNTAGMVVISHDAQFFPALMDVNTNDRVLFDKILADVPCSSDAVMRKLPHKWRRWGTKEGFSLHRLQLQILKKGISLLKQGGTIVYSTCSLNPIENEAVVCEAMRLFGDSIEIQDMGFAFEGSDIKPHPGLLNWMVMVESKTDNKTLIEIKDKDDPQYEEYKSIIDESCFSPNDESLTKNQYKLHNCIRLFPHDSDTSGFFITVIKKVKGDDSDKTVKAAKGDIKETNITIVKDSDPSITNCLVDYYGIDKRFPLEQLVTHEKVSKKICLISRGVYNLLMSDRRNQLKIINVGVKLFKKNKRTQDNSSISNYRICQDGLSYLIPFITKRIFFCNEALFVKLIKEVDLVHRDIPDETMRKELDEISPGCVVMICVKELPYSRELIYKQEEYAHYLRDNYVDAVCCYNSAVRISTMINKEHQHVFNLKYNISPQNKN